MVCKDRRKESVGGEMKLVGPCCSVRTGVSLCFQCGSQRQSKRNGNESLNQDDRIYQLSLIEAKDAKSELNCRPVVEIFSR